MTMVRKIDGEWQALRGTVTVDRMVSTRTVAYQDGRSVEEECEPYPVLSTIDMGRVEQLVRDGVWGEADLAPFGLVVAVPFVVPEGKQVVGQPTYVEKKGKVSEVYEVEDIPPPPPPPTPAEKLAAAGLTTEEFDALVAASIARQGGV